MIVTLALPDLEVSSVLVAATVTAPGEGGAAGAVYVAVSAPVPAIVPIVELPPAIPFTLQVTPAFVVPETLAMNTCAPDDGTLAVWGETLIADRNAASHTCSGLTRRSSGVTAPASRNRSHVTQREAEAAHSARDCLLADSNSRRPGGLFWLADNFHAPSLIARYVPERSTCLKKACGQALATSGGL